MKIEPLLNGSLRVWLSREELSRWALEEEGSAQRRGLRRLLRRIYLQLEQDSPSRLTAELIPVSGGGVLLVTPTNHRDAAAPLVYRIADEDGLLELMGQWRSRAFASSPACCLYSRERGYDLAVYPEAPLSVEERRLLSEYGRLLGTGAGLVAHSREYGILLAAGPLLTAPAPQRSEPTGHPH